MPETTVTEILDELGETADAVADRLRALEVKGVRNDPCACPIACYLAARGFPGVATERTDISYSKNCRTASVKPPDPVAHFIRLFDRGWYPDLVEPDREATHA